LTTKGLPNNPSNMRRHQTASVPAQEWDIFLLVGGVWVLVGHSRHAKGAKAADFWIFTSPYSTWVERDKRHYFGMLRLKEEYGGAILLEAEEEAARADGAPGPGREPNPLVNKVVEKYAENRTIEVLEGLGCHSFKLVGKPYDIECITKDGRVLHVEVKGTQGTGKVVELTKNEVRHNQEECETGCDAQVLVVVSGITVTGLQCSGGLALGAKDWNIVKTDLTMETCSYKVPQLTALTSV
jgi:Domain of unknown function (DUF3883)